MDFNDIEILAVLEDGFDEGPQDKCDEERERDPLCFL